MIKDAFLNLLPILILIGDTVIQAALRKTLIKIHKGP